MVSEYSRPTHILDLPPEIIVNIISKLPYEELDAIRLACSAFNNLGKYLKNIALHKMSIRAESAMRKCQSKLKNVDESRLLRALRGEFSVRCLSGIIQTVDAVTLPFILDGTLLPTPTVLLLEIEKALQLALKRGLIGRDRLRNIYTRLNKYLTDTMGSIQSPPKLMTLFHCLTDLLQSLLHVTYSIVPTDYGFYCLVYLDFLLVTFNRRESYSSAVLMIMTIAKVNLKSRLQDYINQDMYILKEKGRNDIVAVNHIELTIECATECDEVNSLGQICLLEPTDFQVVIYWTSDAPTDHVPNIEEFSSYSFKASANGCVRESRNMSSGVVSSSK